MKMDELALVGAGGFLGSVLRALLGGAVQAWAKGAVFPFGTIAVNAVGCFAIGVVAHVAESRGGFSPATRSLLFTGILGGFTTFSAFAHETQVLARLGGAAPAAANVAIQVGLGLAAVWAGRAAAIACRF
jgi:CrcB protein